MILLLVAFEAILCLILFIGASIWNSKYDEFYSQFIPKRYSYGSESLVTIFTGLVLFNTIVPISLVISLEMVKVIQAYFISKDEDMLDPVVGRYSRARSTQLNEDLG